MSGTVLPDAGSPQAPPGVPVRAEGVRLLGELGGSGYREPPALARRSDGQTIQLTPLLYAVLEAVDGRRTADGVAERVAAVTGRPVTADNVETLVGRLRELGLLARADGSQPELRRSDPLLGLRLKVAVTDPRTTRRLTQPLTPLFHPLVAVPVLVGFAVVCWWVLLEKGLASATHEAFERPGLLLAVLAVTVLSGGLHELGHAAAARRGGADPGVMGAGVYLVWPAFYTDVTDSYRLGRGGRLRTDLGGLYFNAIVVVATFGVWWASGWDAVLLVVAAQVLQMVRQLLPLVRFDGYHVLADLTGVPDLFQRIGPTLRGLLPWRPAEPEARALKPWARAVVTVWVLTVVPLLGAAVVLLVLAFPRVVGTALASADAHRRAALDGAGDGAVVTALAQGLSAVVVLLPVVLVTYLLARLARQVSVAVWRRTAGRPGRRAVAVVVASALVAGLAWAWWPTDQRYRPVQAWEGGTLGDAVLAARPPTGLAVGSEGAGVATFPDGAALPTREQPVLATVLVPSEDGTAASSSEDPAAGLDETGSGAEDGTGQASPGTDPDAPWIFPFDEPLAPGPGDNQAVAVATTDGATTYDVAFALVWADGSEPVTSTNEAFAAASCEGCTAVAVAFQVVLVLGDADVAVPQNLAVAVNHECTSCLTVALAVQLFVTLDGPLSAEATARVEELWADAMAFGASIGSVPLDEIQGRLTELEEQLLAVVEADQGPLVEGSPSPSGTSSPTEASNPSDGAATPSTTPTSSAPTDGTTTSGPSDDPSTGSTTPSPSGPTTTGAPASSSPASPFPSSPTASATAPSSSAAAPGTSASATP